MIDAEELYYRLLNAAEEAGFDLSDDADEALADAARQVVEDHEDESDDRGPNDRYSMYTREGNDVVAGYVNELVADIRTGRVTRKQLPEFFDGLRKQVADAGHGEVYDTEPRGAILDVLDKECDAQGWVHLNEF